MKNAEVTILDYNAGNLKSIVNMLDYLGVKWNIASCTEEIEKADRIIFPGQGHFAQAMQNLKEKNLVEPIKNIVAGGVPFLGICLGLQILFEKSEEALNVDGLGILKGYVEKFKVGKTPQIGWNMIKTTNNNSYLKDDYYYFVNSYYVVPDDKNIISAQTNYHVDFCSAVEKDNIVAVQFHPEKSSDSGCEFFKNWLNKT